MCVHIVRVSNKLLQNVCVTPERIGHSQTSDRASLMKTAVKAIKRRQIYTGTHLQSVQTDYLQGKVSVLNQRGGGLSGEHECTSNSFANTTF